MSQVSLIITTYNRAELVRGAIASALNCGLANPEVVVVDDGSSDHTASVVGEFGDRVRYLRRANGGVAVARNAGAVAAAGDYIAFLDDDDEFLPGGLPRLVSTLDRHAELDVVAADVRVGNASEGYVGLTRRRFGADTLDHIPGTELEPGTRLLHAADAFREGLRRTLLAIGGFVMRRAAFERSGGFNPGAGQVEDWEFYLRVAGLTSLAFQVGPPVTSILRLQNSRSSDPEKMRVGYAVALEVLRTNPRLPPEFRAMADQSLRDNAFGHAYEAYARGDLKLARERFRSYRRANGWSARGLGYEVLCHLPPRAVACVRQMWRAVAGRRSTAPETPKR